MKALIVIPCFNEAHRIIKDQFELFAQNNPNIEFLFVNDGSYDDTLLLLKEMCTNQKQFHYWDIQPNGGKAEAVRKGFLYAYKNFDFEYIAFWDADLQIPLTELPTFIQMLDEGFDIVMAMRIKRLGSTMKRSISRHILSRCFATCASYSLDLPVYDTQCGAKLFKRRLIEDLFSEPFISKWLFDIELLARYKKRYGKEAACNRILEQPLRHLVDAEGSNIKLIDWLKSPIELLKIKKHY